jgi:hypothetical protein
MTKTLAYYKNPLIMAIKSFIGQASGVTTALGYTPTNVLIVTWWVPVH